MDRALTTGAVAGLVGGVALTLAMFVGRFQLGAPLLPELIAEWVFAVVPMNLFSFVVRRLGFAAKWLAFGSAVLLQVGMGTALGVLFGSLTRRLVLERLPLALLYATALWALTLAVFLPLLGGGFFGTRLAAPFLGAVVLLAEYQIYGLCLAAITRRR